LTETANWAGSNCTGAPSRAFTDAKFHDTIMKAAGLTASSQNFAEHFMPLFSERVSMLEVQNSALKKTARERAERIAELERELQRRGELPQDTHEHINRLQRELEQARRLEGELQQMTRELERVKAEREFYCKRVDELEEHNRVLTEAATKYSLWGQKLFSELATLDPDGAQRRDFGTGSWM
jgi:chromosome segregation ATPase